MIGVVTALPCEARPLARHFALKKDTQAKSMELFRGEEMALIVSGIGKIRSAVATTYLLSRFAELKTGFLLNIGVCGAARPHPIGQLLLIHKITDRGTGRRYYPDMIVKHDLPEAGLHTFDEPVFSRDNLPPDWELVDMEAAGFFEAASIFLPPSQIYCLKVVSDHLEKQGLSQEFIGGLIEKNLGCIERFIKAQVSLTAAEEEILSGSDRRHLQEIIKALRLTTTQQRQLNLLARSFRVRTGKSLDWMMKYSQSFVKSKHERKEKFEQLKRILTTS